MRTAPLLPVFAVLALALGACKVSVGGGANPDEARPNPDGEAQGEASGGDVASEGDVTSEGDSESAPGDEGDEGGSMASGDDFAAAEGGEAAPADSPCPEGVNPGESFKDDCNSCRCTDDGKAMCTRMACSGGESETGPQ